MMNETWEVLNLKRILQIFSIILNLGICSFLWYNWFLSQWKSFTKLNIYLSEMKTYWSSPHITLLYKITGKGSIVLAELAHKVTVMLGYYKFYENPKLPAKFLEHIIYSIFHGKGMRVKKKKKTEQNILWDTLLHAVLVKIIFKSNSMSKHKTVKGVWNFLIL